MPILLFCFLILQNFGCKVCLANRSYSSVIKNDKPCKSSHVTSDSVFMNYNGVVLDLKSMNDLYFFTNTF